jgi:Cys-tRNA(Pro)/Cys-tRNA(Cys) deacylase
MSSGTPATVSLDRATVSYRLHSYRHDSGNHAYGDEAAAALGIEPRRIFKTLIVSADGRLACAVVPVATKLDLRALAVVLGAKRAELADPAKAQRATGYVLGGISPFGHRSALPVVVDESVSDFDTVFVSAGKRGLQVEVSPDDLCRVTGAVRAALSVAG